MRLRVWLGVTSIAACMVVFSTISVFTWFFEKRAVDEIVVQSVTGFMQNGGRQACEADPAGWSAEIFGHGAEEKSARSDGPAKPWVDGEHPLKAFRGSRRLPFHRQMWAYGPDLKSANPAAPALSDELQKQASSGRLATVSGRGKPLLHREFDPGPGPGRGTDFPGGPPDGGAARNAPDGPHGPMGHDGGHGGAVGHPEDRGWRPAPHMAPPFGEMMIHRVLIPMPWKTGPCSRILVIYDEPLEEGSLERFLIPLRVWIIPVAFMLVTMLIAAGPVVRRIRRLTRQVRQSADDGYRQPVEVAGTGELGELARAFEDARAEIRARMSLQEEREQNLRRFLENTTHDISIPLTVLQGHLSELAKQDGSGNPEVVGAAMNEAQYIASLVGNLSIASRLETGLPQVQKVRMDMNGLVQRCVNRHRPIARQTGVSLDYAVPRGTLFVDGDETFIEQAVNNVIFNAIRHNNRSGHVAVILETIADASFSLSVIDDGPGIAEEEMARLTERYYRGGKERGRGTDGQGLGLNIAFQATELHGWHFSLARSEFGGLKVVMQGKAASGSSSD